MRKLRCSCKLYIGHTHTDVAWLWTLDQTREKVQRSFSTVLKLMDKYPEYIFMSSQPQLYQYLKEEDPTFIEMNTTPTKETVKMLVDGLFGDIKFTGKSILT